MCEFCRKFDFGSAKAETDRYGARLCVAGGWGRFPENEQFNFCPVCGEGLRKPPEGRMSNDKAREILYSHIRQCGMLMPKDWIQKNGEGSDFHKAIGVALDALK